MTANRAEVFLSVVYILENGISFVPLFSGLLSVFLVLYTTYRTVVVWKSSLYNVLLAYARHTETVLLEDASRKDFAEVHF